MSNPLPNGNSYSFNSPDLSFSHQSNFTIPLGADAATIRDLQMADLAKTEQFFGDMGDKLRALQQQRPLTQSEQAGLTQADTWRDQVRGEQQALRDEAALASCEQPSRHIANATAWRAICTDPDWCKVGNAVVAFDSFAIIDQVQMASPNVKAQCEPVYRIGDLHKGIQADAGAQLVAQTSLGSGYTKMLSGSNSVKVNNLPVARDGSECLVNCNIMGVGGAKGRIVTETKGAGSNAPPSESSNPEAPPGQRTSARLEELKRQEALLKQRLINVDAADEYVRFKDLNGLIDEMQGTPGTWTDYLAQTARGVAKVGTGLGEGLYELGKMAVSANQTMTNPAGMMLSGVQAQILAENIALGNVTAGSVATAVGQGAFAMVVPPGAQQAWGQGNYVEATVHTAGNIVVSFGTILSKAGGLLRGGKVVESVADDVARAGSGRIDDAARASANMADDAGKVAAAEHADDAAKQAAKRSDDGIHVKPRKLDPLKVPCFNPFDKKKFQALSAADKKKYLREYASQLRRQQSEINRLTADEFKTARDAYKAAGGRNPLASEMQAQFRENFEERLIASLGASLRRSGLSPAQAEAAAVRRAGEIMEPLAALHEPDMVTGGFSQPDPKHMGRTDINSSIGGSWNQGGRLSSMDTTANNAISNGNGNANMNVQLRVCPGK